MLLSFSHRRMLPWVRRGIVDTTKRHPNEVPYHTAHLDHAGERMMRQSMRPAYDRAGGPTKWHDVLPETKLQLWWKSGTRDRQQLGTVVLFTIDPIWIRNDDGRLFHGTGFDPAESGERDDFVWLSEGFLTEAEALAFFCPRNGEAYLGFLMRW